MPYRSPIACTYGAIDNGNPIAPAYHPAPLPGQRTDNDNATGERT